MKLVLGREARHSEETFLNANQSPDAIREAVRTFLRAGSRGTLCTFAPLAAHEWAKELIGRDGIVGEELYATVAIFNGARDCAFSECGLDLEWAVHFDLGDLYSRGELVPPREGGA